MPAAVRACQNLRVRAVARQRAAAYTRHQKAVEFVMMKKIIGLMSQLVSDDRGTETLEWGLVCGLIVVGAIVAINAIGPKVTDMWNDMDAQIPAAD
jgi:Flp pilus assembly pilin Flp